jgi:hypothetical protein
MAAPTKTYSARRCGMKLLFAKLMNKPDDYNGGDRVQPTCEFFVRSNHFLLCALFFQGTIRF